jgi:hypothetical protein
MRKESEARLRLIVCGAERYDDLDTVFRVLSRETFECDELTLVSDQVPGKEWKSSFEPAHKWLQRKFARGRKKFNRTVRHYAPFSGRKQIKVGMHHMRLKMVQDADALIAFKDVGAGDRHTDELIRLARLYDLKVKVFLV